MPKLMLLSSSRCHGFNFLEHCSTDVFEFFDSLKVKRVLFIPYASSFYDKYAAQVRTTFSEIGLEIDSIHELENPAEAVEKAEGIYIGGGNTFLLLKTLYENNVIEAIRKRVLKDGIPYMGSSAGSNVSTVTINTTNDMPIVYPPSFKALGLVPFNINPHYLDPDANSKHCGETRETRIKEYHEVEDNPSVLGLREGSWLNVNDDRITLCGRAGARLFAKNKEPVEYPVGADLSFLMKN